MTYDENYEDFFEIGKSKESEELLPETNEPMQELFEEIAVDPVPEKEPQSQQQESEIEDFGSNLNLHDKAVARPALNDSFSVLSSSTSFSKCDGQKKPITEMSDMEIANEISKIYLTNMKQVACTSGRLLVSAARVSDQQTI
jgi:hypothetical protein